MLPRNINHQFERLDFEFTTLLFVVPRDRPKANHQISIILKIINFDAPFSGGATVRTGDSIRSPP